MIFQTNNDNTGIITFLQARKLAEQELTATIQQKQAILATDAVALKTYEVEVAKGTVSTERFAVIMKGASTEAQNYAVSTKGATGSTQAFVMNQQKTINALKNTEKASLSASLGIKALNIALNMGAMLAFSLVVKAVTWTLDTAITTLEEQKEKVDECASAYESAQTELSSITSELESQTQAMNDLLAKDKLTYAEKGQLEELQQITKELQIQKDIADRKEFQSQKDLAIESAKLVNKQYGKESASIDKINEYQLYNDGMIGKLIIDPNNLSTMIAGYREVNEALEEAYSSNNEDDIEYFKNLTDEVSSSIWNIVDSLSAQQSNMQDYYNTIKDTPYEDLTTDQKLVVDAYRKTADEIKLIYSELDPNAWNDIEISNIFNTSDIEKTKDELIEMAKSGELTPETIASYKNLNDAISGSEIFLKNGQTAAQVFCDEIYACTEAKNELNSENSNEPPIFSLSDESITTAIDDFQKKIKTLQNAISDFQNNAEFDKTDLFQEFPELIHQSDNLESAIENLMQNALEELLETLNNPPDELRRELEKLVTVISVDTKQAVEDNLSSYRELYNILHMVQAGENIQQNVLATLINKYGDLAGAVVRTTDGYTLEEKAVTTLINKYVESSNTAIAAQIDITKQTIDNIKARISAYQTETRALNELVAAQTRQYQTIGEYLSAKGNGNVLDQNAIRDASARFGADAVSSYVDYIKNGGASQIKELEDAEAYLEKLKKSLKSPLESKSSSSSESSSSKSTSEIDWMTNSINNLQSAVDGLEQSFNNAKGIKNQKKALKELNKELHTLRDSYYSLTDNSDTVYGEYSKRYKGSLSQLGSNSASIKAKIEAGDIFDLSEFSSDTAELINAAIDAWNGMTDSKNKYIELGVQLEENSVKLIQMDIDAISSKMDLANIKLDSSVSDDRKLKIYDDLAKKTEEYYIKKLELAKLEEDSVQYDSLKVEKANALKDIEEEKLEIIRKQNDAVVDGIDRQINNINTSVELNGGKYLSSDYDNLLLLNEQKMAQLLSNYNRELTNLSDLRAAIGENSAEYREQKSRVDSIADSIDDCKINSKEWTKALLELPIKEIETSVKNLNEQLSGVKDSMSDVEQMISGATAYIKQEIEDQQKLKNVIQEQLDNLKNSNSEHERAIALQKAQYELDRAYKQKTTKVYRDGQGFVYEQSQSAIRTAQENLNKANYDIAIAALEKQLDYYDEIIEELQEVQDKWSYLTGKAQEFLDIQVAISKLGIDKILSGDGIDTYTDYYTALLKNQNALEESVASLEDLQVRLEDIVDMYHMGMIDASQATSLLRDALAGVYGAINTETGESTAASIQNIINRIKELNGINFTFDELILRISDVFTEFQQANYEDIDTFAGKISNLIEQFYKLESAGDVTAISDWLSSIKDLGGSDFIDAETIVDIIDLYRQTVSAASDTSAAADIVEETANNVETTVDTEKKKVNEAISDVEEDAKKGEEIISSLSEKIDLILSKLDELSSSEFMAKFSQEQLVQAESFTSQLENCFSSMAENIASNISSVFNNLNSELSRIASEAASTASSIHSMVSNANLKASELQTTKNQVAAITTSNTSNTIKQTSTGKFTMMKYHDGIENGLVGGKPEKVLQTAALDKLETNEIPALLEIDEAVLTRFQQNNIVENMKKSFTAGLNFIPQRDTSSINMQFGNINVTEVDNGQEVVDYLVSNLKPRIQQVLSKR